ncbi:MAG: hypothetical protein KC620_10590, partial [Myxococcales bacterium]|nr:hypothetical protein [Myxococcales bacterium]
MASFDLPAELSARYRPLAALEGPPGVQQYEVRDGNGRRVLLTLTARPTLFDDPLSAFHGAAGECFVPGTPPTPVAAIARALHRLDHAAVPRSLAAGAVERRPYVVTAPARGVPLADHPLPLRASEVVELARALFSVLAHAHARGVVHRALTLQNVHWSPDGVGLDGFGFASIDGLAPPAMAIDAVIRAPEVVDEKSAVDPAVDLYAAGVVLYAALSGAPPFSEPQSLAFDHAFSSVPPMPPGTPPALGALVNGLLQKERDKRTPSALAALTALANASADRLRATTDPLVQLTAAAARPGRAFSALRARETIDDVNPLTAARLLLRLDRAEGALRICVSAEDRSGARAEMRVLAGRSLLALGRVEEGIKAFGLALDATPPPSIASMLDLIDAAAAVPRHDVAVDAAIRAGVLAPEQGAGALGRVVGLAV